MDALLETFIESGKGENFRRIDELELDVTYNVVEFTRKKTTFGTALEGHILDPLTFKTFTCYFPDRLAKKIRSEEECKFLNEKQLSFKFKGRVNKIAILEFFKVD